VNFRLVGALAAAALLAAATGCGSSNSSRSRSTNTAAPTAGAGLLTAEAQSAATGDIPDNQVYLPFNNTQAHYSINAPEGWTRQGAAGDVTLTEKNNRVHIVVLAGASKPTVAAVAAELQRLRASNPTLTFSAPTTIKIGAGEAVKATYTTRSAPNPVTGKQVVLNVDRYQVAGPGTHAIIDLGTPQGVDNIDAYRKMINSFRWQ
jgi:hypothetical protein